MKYFIWVCFCLCVFGLGFYIGFGCNVGQDAETMRVAQIEISSYCAEAVPAKTTIVTNINGEETRSVNIGFVSRCVCTASNGTGNVIEMNAFDNTRFNAVTPEDAVSACEAECQTICQDKITKILVEYSEFVTPMNW